MSEVEILEQEKDENSVPVSEIFETTCDVAEKTDEEEVSLLTLESQPADHATLELASVDVTVESKEGENEEQSASSTEPEVREEENSEEVSLLSEQSEVTHDSAEVDDNADGDKELGEDGEDELENETVTCSLLGLEQAKVTSFILDFVFFFQVTK